jgi:hypothetical protein
MTAYISPPEPITVEWATAALRASGALPHGQVIAITSAPTDAFNSATSRLVLSYSPDVPPELPTRLILKRNLPEPWAIAAGAEEARFYQLAGRLDPPPPAVVPCVAAAIDPATGDSYLLLRDLSETHRHAVTREQQLGIVEAVPGDDDIARVIEALAWHHAYWWDHPALHDGSFQVGYWSRDAERFRLYRERRLTSWEQLLRDDAGWFPADLRALYEMALDRLERHWERDLAPRFERRSRLTLVHGDSFFANFLTPRDAASDDTYLLDWQSPTTDIGGYDLANLLATFWTPQQRRAGGREERVLRRYLEVLQARGVRGYEWDDLVADYQAGLIYWLLVPLQDRYDGAPRSYWWPKIQCLAAAFREWRCDTRL